MGKTAGCHLTVISVCHRELINSRVHPSVKKLWSIDETAHNMEMMLHKLTLIEHLSQQVVEASDVKVLNRLFFLTRRQMNLYILLRICCTFNETMMLINEYTREKNHCSHFHRPRVRE